MFADLVALLRHPLTALNTIDLDRRLQQGLIALGLSIVLPALVSELAGFRPWRPPAELGSLPALTAQGADIYAHWSYDHRFVLPTYGVVISLALWLLAVALIHGIARTLGGRGDFAGFLKLAGYVALIGVIALPFELLDALAQLQGNGRLQAATGQLSGLIGVAVFAWQNVLLIYAARQHYRISTERAVASVIGPIGGVAVLVVAVIVVGAILFVVTQSV